MLRHNLFLAPNVGTKCVDAEGLAVNMTQKPTLTTLYLGHRLNLWRRVAMSW